MRLFISYARVDKPFCSQVVDVLDVHDVWYDQRLHAGQQWWDQIRRRIEWAEGFIYLLSPDSVDSEYCRKEFELAVREGKHIFPVLIHGRTVLPEWLHHIQYADFTRGITMESVKMLLNSIYIAERDTKSNDAAATIPTRPAKMLVEAPRVNPTTVIDEVADAFDTSEYDRAVFLLRQVREAGYKPRFVNIEAVLQEAEAALEHQAYLREAEREYKPIVALVKHKKTRRLGCDAFQQFRTNFPDYDPANVASVCMQMMLPMLAWCAVPGGEVRIKHDDRTVVHHVNPFKVAKYPVTNAQFQVFIDAVDGYGNQDWWDFSPEARAWRAQNTAPLPPRFPWGTHPRANICWYEAVAFCNWLSVQTGNHVYLPSEPQWQRAAQGDDSRMYPWGNRFSRSRCNTKESRQRTTVPVTYFEDNVSPYGVRGMAGNVWEWCSTTNDNTASTGGLLRAVKGGSYISVAQRSRTTFRFFLNPLYQYATIGFRVATDV